MTNPIDRLFIEHPRSVGESYGKHFRLACGVGVAMVGAGFACFVHALFPALFQRTGSATIHRLHDEITWRLPEAPPEQET
jgi:hypothetical protein